MTTSRSAPIPFDLWGQRGQPWFSIVGESYYGDAIASVLRRRGLSDESGEASVIASLVREPHNPYDPNAVAVTIDGLIVGHLAREAAPAYHQALDLLAQRGCTSRVDARLWWSGSASDGSLWSSVTLDLAAPHLIVPVNTEPPGSRLLPLGRKLQVKERPEALHHLAQFVSEGGPNQVSAWALLDSSLDSKGRELVAVHVDGVDVGFLTPQSSSAFVPVINWGRDNSLAIAAQVELVGNQLDVQVAVMASKANELPTSWFESPAAGVVVEPAVAVATPPDGWYPDPGGRHEFRHWSAGAWSAYVCDRGAVATDPL